jgi:hypothetical protein
MGHVLDPLSQILNSYHVSFDVPFCLSYPLFPHVKSYEEHFEMIYLQLVVKFAVYFNFSIATVL